MITRAALSVLPFVVLLAACSSPVLPRGDSEPDPNDNGGKAAGVNADAGPGATPNANGSDRSVIDLGEVQAGAPLTFDVPRGTVGFTIVVDGNVTANEAIGVAELGNPSGAVVIRDFVDAKEPGRATRGDLGTGVGVVPVPLVGNHALDPVPAGKWTLKIGGVTGSAKGGKGSATPWAGRAHAVVRLQTSSDGTFRGGALDLDLYVPDGLLVSGSGAPHAITAASAGADADLAARLTITFALFRRLYGLERGDVRYHALPSSVAAMTSQADVEAANRLARFVSARPSAQVVLTNLLSPDGDGGEISGVSNCLPGAVGVPGTVCSAVIVSLRSDSPPWQDAATLVHELGHFAGLEHTTEFDGYTDTLGDTPACQSLGKNQLASCPDHDNLMFPSVNAATAEPSIEVSPLQRALVRASSLYRATP